MLFVLFLFAIAILISCVAAYFSIVGLGALFAATFWGVVVMAASLEIGKIATTKWVHANWGNEKAPLAFRGLLCFFIACLMTITSLGIFGYLSKGYLEQNAPKTGITAQMDQLNLEIQQAQQSNKQLQTRMDQINRITESSLTTSSKDALYAGNVQKKEAAKIQAKMDENNKTINALNDKLLPLKMQNSEVEAKLGPLQYVADLFGLKDPQYAVRMMICLIMVTFDPLALSLFIAASITLSDVRARKKLELDEDPDIINIPEPIEEPVMEEPIEEPVSNPVMDEPIEEPIEEETPPVIEEPTQPITEHDPYEDIQHSPHPQLETWDELIPDDGLDERARVLDEITTDLMEWEEKTREREEQLAEWEKLLIEQQKAINTWNLGENTPKETIIDLLEKNPSIVHDIVQVAESMRKIKPGL